MKTLKTIQTLARIGKILSKICFILSLVGAGICIVGLICLPLGGEEILKIGGITLHGLTGVNADEGVRIAAVALSGWSIVCIGEAVLAKFAQRYFANELTAGTPFTPAGAGELMRLGILSIALSVGSVIVSEIVQAIMAAILDVAIKRADVSFDPGGAIALGIMFIVAALLCRYGAEITNETGNADCSNEGLQAVTEQ